MCAILDNDLRDRVFGAHRTLADREFLEWIRSGRRRLVVGGKLKRELSENNSVKEWLDQFASTGSVKLIDDEEVDAKTAELEKSTSLTFDSNDHHIIALAQISGVRLLHSNDKKLGKDFRNTTLINNPKGVIYPSSPKVGHRRWFLSHRHLCTRSS